LKRKPKPKPPPKQHPLLSNYLFNGDAKSLTRSEPGKF
jgi:putative transposase